MGFLLKYLFFSIQIINFQTQAFYFNFISNCCFLFYTFISLHKNSTNDQKLFLYRIKIFKELIIYLFSKNHLEDPCYPKSIQNLNIFYHLKYLICILIFHFYHFIDFLRLINFLHFQALK
jgi:hypothetical protein